jgi:uncharacterized Zn-binding protein involved in type VI secretion
MPCDGVRTAQLPRHGPSAGSQSAVGSAGVATVQGVPATRWNGDVQPASKNNSNGKTAHDGSADERCISLSW